MSEIKVNTDMFGKYAIIPTGYYKERHIYKVVGSLCSNSYCDVPIVHGSEPKRHELIETVLNVIHCGIDETNVIRVSLKDCEIVKPKTKAEHIRSMSDEELAKFLVTVETLGYNDQSISGSLQMFEWLQSEVEKMDTI